MPEHLTDVGQIVPLGEHRCCQRVPQSVWAERFQSGYYARITNDVADSRGRQSSAGPIDGEKNSPATAIRRPEMKIFNQGFAHIHWQRHLLRVLALTANNNCPGRPVEVL